jgi:hypothetical protein
MRILTWVSIDREETRPRTPCDAPEVVSPERAGSLPRRHANEVQRAHRRESIGERT